MLLLTLTTASPLVLAAAFFLLVPTILLLQRYLNSPLNGIPGPWWARLSAIPLFYKSAVCRQQAQTIEDLHKQYGPIVRIAPGEVAVSSQASFKAVHKIGSGFTKSIWYGFIGPTEKNHGPAGMFQELDPHRHAQTRKMFSRGFSTANLRVEWEDMVRSKVVKAVKGIAAEADRANGLADVRRWWTLMASDVVSEVAFGEALGGLDTQEMHPFFHKVFASNLASTMYYYMPVLYEVLSRIPVPALTDFFNAWRALLDIASIAYKNSLSNASKKNIFSEILAKAENDPEGRLTPMQVTVEAGGLIIAGSDTTSESLTYLIWAALKRPEVQQALQDELLAHDLELRDAELEKLPVLNAVIKETLRLYSAVPMPQPRVVPKGGVTLEGQFLPEGTVVNTTPYVSHRDPAVFPNPENFDYTRWLPNGSATLSNEARAAWWAFGAGSYTCIGQHLAMMELRLACAMFFQTFHGARLGSETTDDSMTMMNYVVIAPKGERLMVDFSQVNLLPEGGYLMI
ncbi:Cytochrome P450 monooxygenase [Sphaerulina musiva]